MAPVSRRERIVLNDSGSWAPGSFRGDYDNNLLKGTVDGPTRQRVTSALCQKAYVRSINFARQQRPSQPESQANLVRADRNYGLEARAIPQGPPPPHLPGRPHPPAGAGPVTRGVSVCPAAATHVITFLGLIFLRTYFYLPNSASGATPGVIWSIGFSSRFVSMTARSDVCLDVVHIAPAPLR